MTLSIVAVCIGRPGMSPAAEPVSAAEITEHGLDGDRHDGPLWVWTSRSGKRTEAFNERQWSAVSQEEVGLLEERLGIAIPLGALGENFRVAGRAEFSKIPCGATLRFPSGALLGVAGANAPCRKMADYLARLNGKPHISKEFFAAARDLRGLVGWVDVPGRAVTGDVIALELPEVPVVQVN